MPEDIQGQPDIRPFQQCRSLDGWHPVLVPSSSSDATYVVLVNPWGTSAESICECKGFTYGGHCKHQLSALNHICGWSEIFDPERQSPEERTGMRCPRCSNSTTWQMEVIE